jgi:Ca2+-binding EF-hand superfamily protein
VAYTTPMQPHQPGAAQVDLQDAARQAFRNFDRNRNGTIDRHEFLMVRF